MDLPANTAALLASTECLAWAEPLVPIKQRQKPKPKPKPPHQALSASVPLTDLAKAGAMLTLATSAPLLVKPPAKHLVAKHLVAKGKVPAKALALAKALAKALEVATAREAAMEMVEVAATVATGEVAATAAIRKAA